MIAVGEYKPVDLLQPEDSKIIVHDREDNVAFEIPRKGVWAGSKGLMSG